MCRQNMTFNFVMLNIFLGNDLKKCIKTRILKMQKKIKMLNMFSVHILFANFKSTGFASFELLSTLTKIELFNVAKINAINQQGYTTTDKRLKNIASETTA